MDAYPNRVLTNRGNTMKTITIELPDTITINGAGKAPESLRNVSTANWSAEFCLTAIIHGVSQKIGDTWSVTKGDLDKTQAVHDNMTAGDWSRRASNGVSDAKLQEKISKLDVTKLAGMLTPGQLRELLDLTVQPKG